MQQPQAQADGDSKVLVVDDEPNSRDGLVALLEDEGFTVASAANGEQALEVAEAFRPDLVVSDVCMPDMDGYELARALRETAYAADTPLILISARHEIDRRVRALNLGADDFMPKPLDLDELLARVRAHLRRARRHSQVLRMSVVDELTSALNRRGLFLTLEREIRRAHEDGVPLSVLYVDVDGFKEVNDVHGHAAGDAVLQRTVELLCSVVPADGSVGRLGGDELVMVLPRTDSWGASAIAARVRSVEGPGRTNVTLSVGTASLRPGENSDELLSRADERMYEEKTSAKWRKRRGGTPMTDSTYVSVAETPRKKRTRDSNRELKMES
jgi:diguanylate cyclase (GGDEF)-like protein